MWLTMKGREPEWYMQKLSMENCLKSAKIERNMGRVYWSEIYGILQKLSPSITHFNGNFMSRGYKWLFVDYTILVLSPSLLLCLHLGMSLFTEQRCFFKYFSVSRPLSKKVWCYAECLSHPSRLAVCYTQTSQHDPYWHLAVRKTLILLVASETPV